MKSLDLRKKIIKLQNKEKAKNYQWFFKTKKGEYGFGDQFRGLSMSTQHLLAKEFIALSLNDLIIFLQSKYHEERMIALLILTYKYSQADIKGKKQIYNFYLKNKKAVNNWDLVDVTTPKIMGEYLIDHDRKVLYKFAKSDDLWEKRMAILATLAFIKKNDFQDTLKIAEILLNDKHDLIHKAVGWMLREIGKRDLKTLEEFLKPVYKNMPRTMLRYAIEKFPREKYKKYLTGKI